MLMKIVLLAVAVALANGQSYRGVARPAYTAPVISYAAPRPVYSTVVAAPQPARYVAAAQAEEQYPPQPFSFSYDTVDEYGTKMTRQESGDGSGAVTGSYSYQDAYGISRVVQYVADHDGFRASIQTNEPGTETSAPAGVSIQSTQK